MKKVIRKGAAMVFVTATILGSVVCADAGDLCVGDAFQTLKFSKVKLPKKPTSATTVQGVFVSTFSGMVQPFSGSAARLGNGSIVVGITVHGLAASNDFTLGWTTDATLAGTIAFDGDGDFHKDDGTFTVTPVDCATLTVP